MPLDDFLGKKKQKPKQSKKIVKKKKLSQKKIKYIEKVQKCKNIEEIKNLAIEFQVNIDNLDKQQSIEKLIDAIKKGAERIEISKQLGYSIWKFSCTCKKPHYTTTTKSKREPRIKFCKFCHNPMDMVKK